METPPITHAVRMTIVTVTPLQFRHFKSQKRLHTGFWPLIRLDRSLPPLTTAQT